MKNKLNSVFIFSKRFCEVSQRWFLEKQKPIYFKDCCDNFFQLSFSGTEITAESCDAVIVLRDSNSIVALFTESRRSFTRNDEKIFESGCLNSENLDEVLNALRKASAQF